MVSFYCLFMRSFGAISATVDLIPCAIARTTLTVRTSECERTCTRLLVIISWLLEKNNACIVCMKAHVIDYARLFKSAIYISANLEREKTFALLQIKQHIGRRFSA